MTATTYPRLIADIGGTNARFCLEIAPYHYENAHTFQCKNFPNLVSAIKAYLQLVNAENIEYAALALPCPIAEDRLVMVNSPWQNISISNTKQELDLKEIVFLNDFHALALAIPQLPRENLVKVGGLEPEVGKPIGIVGPGTGLGVATLLTQPNGDYLALPAEGGHSTFTAASQEEFEIWQYVQKRFQHVSAERLISGTGMPLIYEALCAQHGVAIEVMPNAADITHQAIHAHDWISQLTLDHFCRMLGTLASNLAAFTNAFGGVYIGGGIIPKILPQFLKSDFRCRFDDKGRFSQFVERIPIYVITEEFPAFYGASYALEIFTQKGYLP